MKYLAIIILCLLSACSYRPDPIRKADVVRHSVMTGLMVLDWQQTLEIANNGPEYHESINSFIGKHPSEGQVNTYFAVSYGVKSVVAWLLPQKWREPFQYLMIGGSAVCVGRNWEIGLQGQW